MTIHDSRVGLRPPMTRAVIALVAVVGLIAALIAAGHATAASKGGQVRVRTTPLGKILVSSTGRTLYMFAADKGKTSVCYGQCATFWPPLLSASAHPTATGLTMSKLGTTKRKDGKLQITYNGHPLYRYADDTKAGQTNGQGVNASGGLWWVLSPSGAPIKKKATTTTTTTSTTTTTGTGGGGGGGYGGSYGP
jgi:predicted lipoprotein with Yx(FWY)xxD motif